MSLEEWQDAYWLGRADAASAIEAEAIEADDQLAAGVLRKLSAELAREKRDWFTIAARLARGDRGAS